MSSRIVRVLLIAIALAATGLLAYRAVQDESAAVRDLEALRQVERTADGSLTLVHELRAALYAYVVTGQGLEFWAGRAAVSLGNLRSAAQRLDAAAINVEVPPGDPGSLDVTKLTAAELRARNFARDGQVRLAADIVFSDARPLLDGLGDRFADARETAVAASRGRQQALRRQQLTTMASTVGLWIVVALLLLPRAVVRVDATPVPVTRPLNAPTPDVTPPQAPRIDLPLAPPPALPPRSEDLAPAERDTVPDLAAIASICGDLARVSETAQVSSLVERAGRALDASGLIVWMSDTQALHPAAAWGYDELLLARVSSIPHGAANLTATAFMSGSLRTTAAQAGSPAALAAPLTGPDGTVGVLSAEMRSGGSVPAATAALASIFAAQLVTVIGAMPQAEQASGPPEPVEVGSGS